MKPDTPLSVQAQPVASPSETKLVSIVVPTYKSQAFIAQLVERVADVFAGLPFRYELILVNDASPDGTWGELKRLRDLDPARVRIFKLLKNSGQHNAILCGLHQANGDIVLTMDDDLQHPPEEIPKLIAKLDEGYDLVIGAYDDKRHAGYRNIAGSVVDRTIRLIYGLPSSLQLTSFRAMRRQLVEVARLSRSPYPYVTCILLDQAGSVTNVPVRHKEREHGTSSYSLTRSVVLATNLLFSYSSLPIYATAVFSGLAALGAIGVLGWIVWQIARGMVSVPGWTSVITITTFLSSLILASLFVVGMYVARIHHQISGKKVPFIVDEHHG